MRLLPTAVVLVLLAVPAASAQPAILFDPSEPSTSDEVRFATSHDGPWTWTFGDDTPATTDPQPVHRFQHAGIYTVTLHASNQSFTVELPVHLPEGVYADVDEAAYRNRGNDSQDGGNETLHEEVERGSSLWGNTWFLMAVVIAGIGGPGAALVYWMRRREDAAAVRFLDDEDEEDPDDLPLDAYSRSDQPPLENLEDLLPFDDEIEEDGTERIEGTEDLDEGDPFLYEDDEPESPDVARDPPQEDELDDDGILAALRLPREDP